MYKYQRKKNKALDILVCPLHAVINVSEVSRMYEYKLLWTNLKTGPSLPSVLIHLASFKSKWNSKCSSLTFSLETEPTKYETVFLSAYFCSPFLAYGKELNKKEIITFRRHHWDSVWKLTEMKRPAPFSTPATMFLCSEDFDQRAMHCSSTPAAAAEIAFLHAGCPR